MSINELRIDQFTIDMTKNYDQYHSFSIGHESCIIKFFKILQNADFISFLQKQKNKNKSIRILTPFVPQCYLEKMKRVLCDLLNQPLFRESMIIINDLGLMHYIHRIDPDRKLCLGRTLVFSFDFTPWGKLIYDNEDTDIQQVIKQVNILDDVKINYFKSYNIVAVETNITPNTFSSISKILPYGLDVYINESYFLYGIQRSCQTRRNEPDNQCNLSKCDMPLKFKLSSQWEYSEYYINETAEFFPPVLFMRGNQICGRNRFDSKHPFNHIFIE